MTASTDFDRLVASWLEGAGPADVSAEVVQNAFATARGVAQRRGPRAWLLGPAAWPAARRRFGFTVLRPTARIAILLGLLVAGLAAAAYVGSRWATVVLPAPLPPLEGVLVPAPDLLTPRSGAVVVTLADGRVLIAGGDSARVTTAEVFDPATGRSVSTGPLVSADSLALNSAAVLRDGRVLLVGDARPFDSPFFAVAQVFDPTTLQFQPTGAQVTPRAGGVLALLADGRVLLTGGTPPNDLNTTLASAEVFDPETNTFSVTGAMGTARWGHAAVSLADGRVLVMGGLDSLSSAEVYDPDTGTFTPAGSMGWIAGTMTNMTGQGLAFALPDGRAVVVGQSGTKPTVSDWPADVIAQAEVWDPATSAFTHLAHPPHAVSTATSLADGRILLTGQVDRDAGWASIYDPVAQRWQEIDEPTSWSPSATRLADGRVLLLGGITDGNIRPEGGGRTAPAVATMEYVE